MTADLHHKIRRSYSYYRCYYSISPQIIDVYLLRAREEAKQSYIYALCNDRQEEKETPEEFCWCAALARNTPAEQMNVLPLPKLPVKGVSHLRRR